MEAKKNPTGESQAEGAAQQQGGTRLRQALVSTKRENRALAAENAALKEELARKELNWVQENKRLREEIDSLVSTLFMARNDMDNLVNALESAKAREKQLDTELKEMSQSLQDKEEKIHVMEEHLHLQQTETKKVTTQFFDTVTELNAEWERRWIERKNEIAAEFHPLQEECENMRRILQEKDDRQNEMAAEFKSLQEECENMTTILQEKEETITSARIEIVALVENNVEKEAKLKTAEAQIHHNETRWQTAYKAVEDRLRCERAEKEDCFKRTELLQKQSRETEERWLVKEQDWISKVNTVEEQIKVLIRQNIKLQELALKSDKEKAKMRKEEKKAKKEAEKRLKKEKQEKERQEKEERKKEKEREKNERRGRRSCLSF